MRLSAPRPLSPRCSRSALGIPWYALPPIGACIGLGFGVLIAAPALRLDGFYYALLTLGLNELFRVFFTTSKQFGSASGGLYGADSFISQSWPTPHPVDGRLLRIAVPADRRAFSLSLHQRQTTRPCAADGAGKARSLCRSRRGRFQAGADHHLPPDVGGAWIHRRLLCGTVSWRRLFDIRLPDRAARARDDHHRRHRPGGRRGARHVRCDLSARRASGTRTLALSDHRSCDARRRSVPEQRLFRHSPAVQRLAREETRRMAINPHRKRRRDAARGGNRESTTRMRSTFAASTRCSATI